MSVLFQIILELSVVLEVIVFRLVSAHELQFFGLCNVYSVVAITNYADQGRFQWKRNQKTTAILLLIAHCKDSLYEEEFNHPLINHNILKLMSLLISKYLNFSSLAPGAPERCLELIKNELQAPQREVERGSVPGAGLQVESKSFFFNFLMITLSFVALFFGCNHR